jgi:Tol biopolymer transport system component
MLELLEECRSEIGLRTIVALVPSEKVNTPILLGFVRPRLLVPKSITKELTREELRYVFLHELAHVKRHDIALGWLTALLQVLHWFNPLVWLAFHRMRSNRELACDAFVLSRTQGEGTQDYGLAIVSLLEHFSIPQSLPGLAGILESKSQLKRRIAMITQFKNNSYKWSPLAAISVFILACVVLLDAPRGKASEAAGRPEPTLRRIEVLNRATKMHSHPSFDGKYMVLGRSTGDVIRELATGKERDLARPGGGGFAFGESISPDNAKIAYYWYSIEKGDNDIRVASFDGSDDRLLLEAEKISGWFNMDAWSPDARFLFGRYTRSVKNNSVRLVKVSVDDGSMQYIEVVDANGMSKVDISSDGRFLAYDRRDKTTYTSDIFIFDLLENREAILVKHPADDKLLGWTPDGGHIFFTSDSTGTTDGWLLPVRQGKANGRPKLIKPGIGDINPIRFTKDGALYFAIQHESTNIYTVQLDIDAGKALSDVSPVREVGKDGTPDWSPDGRYLAYCSQPDRHKPQIIRIRTLTTGDERQLKLDLPHFDYLRWCPDSLHLLITGPVWGALSNVYKVNVQTGQYVALIDTDRENVRQAELSADGRMLVYRTRGGGNYNRLIMRDLETGHEKELLAMEDGWAALTFGNGWTLLPDGKHVALSIRDDSPGSGYLLQTMSVETGETKTIVPDSVGCLTSVNKGLDLLFVRRGKELWRVSAEGSQPQKVWESEQGIGYPRMHPDGKHLAFVSGISMSEMWLMENFLPRDIVE